MSRRPLRSSQTSPAAIPPSPPVAPMPGLPACDFADAVRQLEDLDLGDLRVRYRQLMRKTAPAHLPRWLLIRMVAYRLQAQVLGDLDADTASLLAGLARTHDAGMKARAKAEAVGDTWLKPAVPRVPAVPGERKIAIGTEFVREFDGRLHRVTTVADGFRWNGTTFGSLSQIAKAITGASWNGPAFFGLRTRKASTDAAGSKPRGRDAGERTRS